MLAAIRPACAVAALVAQNGVTELAPADFDVVSNERDGRPDTASDPERLSARFPASKTISGLMGDWLERQSVVVRL